MLDAAARQGTVAHRRRDDGRARHRPAAASYLPFAAYGDAVIDRLGRQDGLGRPARRLDPRRPRRSSARLRRRALAGDLGTPILEQLIVARAARRMDDILELRREQLRAGRDHLEGLLADAFPEWSVPHVDGGLTTWVNLGAPGQLAARARRPQRRASSSRPARASASTARSSGSCACRSATRLRRPTPQCRHSRARGVRSRALPCPSRACWRRWSDAATRHVASVSAPRAGAAPVSAHHADRERPGLHAHVPVRHEAVPAIEGLRAGVRIRDPEQRRIVRRDDGIEQLAAGARPVLGRRDVQHVEPHGPPGVVALCGCCHRDPDHVAAALGQRHAIGAVALVSQDVGPELFPLAGQLGVVEDIVGHQAAIRLAPATARSREPSRRRHRPGRSESSAGSPWPNPTRRPDGQGASRHRGMHHVDHRWNSPTDDIRGGRGCENRPMHLLAALSMKNRALIALITIVVAIFGGLALTSLKQELAPSIAVPAALHRHELSGRVARRRQHRCLDPDRDRDPGHHRTRVDVDHELHRPLAGDGELHLRHRPRRRRAEDALGGQPHRRHAARRRRPAGASPLSLDDFPVLQLAVTGVDDISALSDEIERTTLPEIDRRRRRPRRDARRRRRPTGHHHARPRRSSPRPASPSQAIRDALAQNGLLAAGRHHHRGRLDLRGADRSAARQRRGHRRAAGARCDRAAARDREAADGERFPTAPRASPTRAGFPRRHRGATIAVRRGDDRRRGNRRARRQPGDEHLARRTANPRSRSRSRSCRPPTPSRSRTPCTALLPDLEASLDTTNPGATFTVVFDQAPFIEQSIESLATEGLLGLLFAVLVILVFLLSVRATLVTAISIPTSVLITFIGLQAADYTLNILTLGALTIAIGRVVDDSIVVIENIKRHLDRRRRQGRDDRARGARGGRRHHRLDHHHGRGVPAARLVGGVTGELFRPFALTVTIALRRVAVRVADDRAGARVLVPEAGEAAQARGRGRGRRGDLRRRRVARPRTSRARWRDRARTRGAGPGRGIRSSRRRNGGARADADADADADDRRARRRARAPLATAARATCRSSSGRCATAS